MKVLHRISLSPSHQNCMKVTKGWSKWGLGCVRPSQDPPKPQLQLNAKDQRFFRSNQGRIIFWSAEVKQMSRQSVVHWHSEDERWNQMDGYCNLNDFTQCVTGMCTPCKLRSVLGFTPPATFNLSTSRVLIIADWSTLKDTIFGLSKERPIVIENMLFCRNSICRTSR